MYENIKKHQHSKLTKSNVRYFKFSSPKLIFRIYQQKRNRYKTKRENSQHILTISTENLFLVGLKKLEISFFTDLLLDCFLSRFHLSVKLKTVDSTFEMKKTDFILASVSFWPLLIIESVARMSQHVLFTHGLLVKVHIPPLKKFRPETPCGV